MQRWMRIGFILLAFCIMGDFAAQALTKLNTKITRIIVFKNGYCMVVKKVTGKIDSDRKALISEVPSSVVLGSFWMLPKDAKPISMVVRQKKVVHSGQSDTEKEIELEFGSNAPEGDTELTWSYFAPGIRWIPTYRIGLEAGNKAGIMMQAEILNELEDLEGIPVDLVVGVPNFRFKSVISPMALQANLVNALQQAAPQLMEQSMSNLLTQRVGEYRGATPIDNSRANTRVGPDLPSSLTGEGSQDLFVYTIPKLTLRAGERAAVPILSKEIPFKHLYTWDVHLQRSAVTGLSSKGVHLSPVKLLKNDVWHQIEINNTTGLPLTTGAALAMDGLLPIAQELLTYTPIAGKTQMPLTVAVDIRGTYEEEEISREANSIKFDGHSYVQIAKEGKLKVTNYKNENISLLITAQFGGNCTKASDDGQFTLVDFSRSDWSNFQGHPALIGHSKVSWQLKLKAGETREVTCQYHYYTR